MARLEHHPIANLVPWMTQDEKQALAVDIRAHGLRAPIVMFEGKILDGRHRAEAWFDLFHNWKVPSTAFEGTAQEAVDFVRSHNIARRHLKESQKAYFESQVAAFMLAKRGGDRRSDQVKNSSLEKTQGEIAKAAGVTKQTIAKAAKAVKQGVPQVATRLRDGKVSVDRALAISAMPKDKQLDALIDRKVQVPKRKPKAKQRPKLEPEVAAVVRAFNQGIDAAADFVDDQGEDALAHKIRELKKDEPAR